MSDNYTKGNRPKLPTGKDMLKLRKKHKKMLAHPDPSILEPSKVHKYDASRGVPLGKNNLKTGGVERNAGRSIDIKKLFKDGPRKK